MAYTVAGNRLVLSNGQEFSFDQDIQDSVEVEDIVVLILRPRKSDSIPDNAYGVSNQGIIWKIETQGRFGTDPASFFCAINGVKDGFVYLAHYGGDVVKVDPTSGEIVNTQFLK